MTNNEKNDVLDELEQTGKIENKDFLMLKNLSSDSDSFIRSRIPIILMDFVNKKSLSLLFNLAGDKDSLVRTEAYDSMSVFPYQSVINFLRVSISKENNALARSYAISSWAESVVLLGKITSNNIDYALKQRSKEKKSFVY